MLPFALASAFESGQFDPTVGGAEFIGLISNEVTATDQRREMRTKFAKALGAEDWNQLALDQQAQIRGEHPELVKVEDLAQTEQNKYESSRRRIEAFGVLDNAKERQVNALNMAGKAFELGVDGSRRGFYFRQRVSRAAERYGEARTIVDKQYADVFADIQMFKREEGQNVVNRAFDEYVATMFGEQTVDPTTLDYNYQAADELKKGLRSKYGNDVIDRVEAELQRRKRNPDTTDPLHPQVLDYYDAIEGLRPYWDVWKTVLKDKDLAMYKAYQNSSREAQQRLLASSPRIRIIQSRVDFAQLRMRQKDAKLDWWLHLYYDNVPRNQDNIMKLARG